MKYKPSFELLLGAEVFLVLVIGATVFLMPEAQASALSAFEFLGAIIAVTITTFGIREMKKLTDS